MVGGAGAGILALALSISAPEIEEFEGQRNRVYRDVVGVLTVCAGHTGPDIVVDKVYSDEECRELTIKDIKEAADGVLRVSPHLVWHPMQLAAATSFAYNVGVTAYARSTVAKRFNEGDFKGACDFLPNYKYAGGKVYNGLIKRRAREREICLSTLTKEGSKIVQSD